MSTKHPWTLAGTVGLSVLALGALVAFAAASGGAVPADDPWPRQFTTAKGNSVTVYQPQVDTLNGGVITARGYLPAWWDRGNLRPAAQRLLEPSMRSRPTVSSRGSIPRLSCARRSRPWARLACPPTVSPPRPTWSSRSATRSWPRRPTCPSAASSRPRWYTVGWYAEPARADLVAALERALGPDEDVAGVLAGMAPRAAGYARLRQALARYRDLAARGGWPPAPAGPRLRLGDHGARVVALAARLAASGELPSGAAAAAESGNFDDAALAAALARFQETHGLAATGAAATSPVVDASTLAALDVPIADRIRQIELNLERWRWAGNLGSRYILVNIPGFELGVIEDGKVVLRMKVIVGKAHRKTPVFSDLLTQVVLNPPWNIPDSIAAGEIAPDLLHDPGYLRRKGYVDPAPR